MCVCMWVWVCACECKHLQRLEVQNPLELGLQMHMSCLTGAKNGTWVLVLLDI